MCVCEEGGEGACVWVCVGVCGGGGVGCGCVQLSQSSTSYHVIDVPIRAIQVLYNCMCVGVCVGVVVWGVGVYSYTGIIIVVSKV